MQLYDIVYEIVLLQTCMHVCVDMHMFIINFPGLHICVVQTVVQILGDVSTSIRCSAAVEYRHVAMHGRFDIPNGIQLMTHTFVHVSKQICIVPNCSQISYCESSGYKLARVPGFWCRGVMYFRSF